jgi:hypothetical protein
MPDALSEVDKRIGPVKSLVVVLTVLGGVLSFVGVSWIAVAAHRGINQLRQERRTIVDWPTGGDKSEEMRAAGISFTTWADLMTIRQDVAIAVLEAARLGPPVALTLAGIVGSTAASVWSLYL